MASCFCSIQVPPFVLKQIMSSLCVNPILDFPIITG